MAIAALLAGSASRCCGYESDVGAVPRNTRGGRGRRPRAKRLMAGRWSAVSSDHTRSSRPSARAGWARSIARTTASWDATSRSRSCRRTSQRTPSVVPASRAKPVSWLRSIIRTSARSTGSRTSMGRRRWSSSWSRARPLPIGSRAGRCRSAEALAIARQLAEALDAAHENGHRPSRSETGEHRAAEHVERFGGSVSDLRAKVLDFGLAKTMAVGLDGDVTERPSGSLDGTADGRILGTPAYMSPEQARGQAVDKRTDIWASLGRSRPLSRTSAPSACRYCPSAATGSRSSALVATRKSRRCSPPPTCSWTGDTRRLDPRPPGSGPDPRTNASTT